MGLTAVSLGRRGEEREERRTPRATAAAGVFITEQTRRKRLRASTSMYYARSLGLWPWTLPGAAVKKGRAWCAPESSANSPNPPRR